MTDMNEMVEAVKKHALENYNIGGWDMVVECWEDREIEAVLTEYGITTVEGAIEEFYQRASIYDERRREVQAEAF